MGYQFNFRRNGCSLRLAWGWCVSLGATAMIDFGLAGIFDRFEQTFGKGITKFILGIIGLTIFTVCIGLIVATATPALVWILSDEPGSSAEKIRFGLGVAILVIYVALGTAFIASAIETRREVREARSLHDATCDLFCKVDDWLKKTEKLFVETTEIHQQIEKISKEQISASEKMKLWSDELERVEAEILEKIKDLPAGNQSPPNIEP